MRIPKDQFDEWVVGRQPEDVVPSPSQVAKIAGVSNSSFFFQRSKGYVEGTVIIALSRAWNLSPVDELMQFEGMGILEAKQKPTNAEVLSQIGPEFLLEELLSRLRHEDVEYSLPPMPYVNGLKRWLDTVDVHGKYGQFATAMGLSGTQPLSRKINDNNLSLGQLMTLCDTANLNARFGLVVTGMMTLEEVGLSKVLREQVLSEVPGQLVIDALVASRKWLEQEVQVKELEAGVHRNLG